MTLSSRVPDLIAAHLGPWLRSWLADLGLSIPRIGSWAVHPGGPRIIVSIEESLGLPTGATEVAREILQQYGNMSSPTILFILECLRRRAAPLPCVALGFGPGMVVEAMLFV
jgi:predicted naringenin-chalcone synthase